MELNLCLCNCDSLLRFAFACGPASVAVLTVCLPLKVTLSDRGFIFFESYCKRAFNAEMFKIRGDLSLPLWLAYTNVCTKMTWKTEVLIYKAGNNMV